MKRLLIILLAISPILLIPSTVKAQTIREFEAEVAKYTKQLEDKQNAIKKNDNEIAEIKKKISNYESQIEQAQQEVEDLEEEIKKNNEEIDQHPA